MVKTAVFKVVEYLMTDAQFCLLQLHVVTAVFAITYTLCNFPAQSLF